MAEIVRAIERCRQRSLAVTPQILEAPQHSDRLGGLLPRLLEHRRQIVGHAALNLPELRPIPRPCRQHLLKRRQRTVYVKGFDPEDADATIERIQEFFSSFGRVLYVRLRREPETKQFKGSCFVEFEDREKAEACVNSASTITWKDKAFACVIHLADWLSNIHEPKKAHTRTSSADQHNPQAHANTRWK